MQRFYYKILKGACKIEKWISGCLYWLSLTLGVCGSIPDVLAFWSGSFWIFKEKTFGKQLSGYEEIIMIQNLIKVVERRLYGVFYWISWCRIDSKDGKHIMVSPCICLVRKGCERLCRFLRNGCPVTWSMKGVIWYVLKTTIPFCCSVIRMATLVRLNYQKFKRWWVTRLPRNRPGWPALRRHYVFDRFWSNGVKWHEYKS